ncbi:MAG TPA: hypothetical protein VJ208_01630 [Candidatus Nanoarchaeia archaeon]|nr:hypothetical protein [Candidatus Nanoarchaeia archaeon]
MGLKFFVILILLLPVLSAVEFDMKTNFSQDETLILKVSGNFFEPILKEDILFFEEHTRIPLIPFVVEIENEFYIYSQLIGKQPGNYSIVIKKAKLFQEGIVVERDLTQNFTITDDFADFSVEPGFVFASEDFFINVQNLQDRGITVNSQIENESAHSESGGFFDFFLGESTEGNEISVKTGETKKINFRKDDFTPLEINKIEISTNSTKYSIPVYVLKTEDKIQEKIKFEFSDLNISIPLNSNTTRIINLYNLDNSGKNFELSVSESLKPYVSFSNISILAENSSEKIEFIFSSGNEEKKIEGIITAKTQDNLSTDIFVSLNFAKNLSHENGLTTPLCSEITGIICSQGQKCNADTRVARDGICCLGVCIEEKKSSIGKIMGWSLVGLVIILLLWFYFAKYKKVRNVVDLLKVAKK